MLSRSSWFVLLAACGGGGSDPGGSRTGYISIQSYLGMSSQGGTAAAAFSSTPGGCTTQTQGACDIVQCVESAASAVSAGTISITGAAKDITLQPSQANHAYGAYMATTPLFAGGETLTFAAAGGEVPAFTRAITAPGKATITSPAKPSAQAPQLVVDRSKDFTLAWTGGGGGEVQINLTGVSATDPRITCHFPASAGTGTIPAAILANLPAGSGGFAVGALVDQSQPAGNWTIDLSAYFNAVWPDDAIVSGPTQLR